MTTALAEEFETHRPRLFSLAYRMLGSAAEAEDAVQDAYLRWGHRPHPSGSGAGAEREGIEQPAAWLTTVLTRLCLNRLTSARARRERYVGPWLPEPVLTADGALGPLESVEQRDAVSTALLLLLERLTPVERAVYVLREAFAYSHREVAETLDLSEANARQLYRRATAHVAAPERRFSAEPERLRALVESFLAAARDGDLSRLETLLAKDVTWSGDGGGKARAGRRPIEGRTKVVRFLAGGAIKFAGGMDFQITEVNGAPGLLIREDAQLIAVATFELRDDVIAEMRAVVNPDKLAYVARQLAGERL
ncbi:RNA polymerase sigma-70 factor [Streptomyces odontomachi]|uniref:RNA polymerase sigma-70 factor n=1 Tax=Streptomyces odontomachi TaxID=2944940 RepID=UPI00210997BB|nr:RNA polymerase sigma-70 factor [Streptomyces sp. ODS25]